MCLVICAIAALRFAFGYMQIIHTYKQGNYKSIEGYVENFVPASSGGEDMEQESFDIKGVHFSYGDRFIKKYCKNRKTSSKNWIYARLLLVRFLLYFDFLKKSNIIIQKMSCLYLFKILLSDHLILLN